MQLSIENISRIVACRLSTEVEALRAQFGAPAQSRVRFCVVDELLPAKDFQSLARELPPLPAMARRKSLGERKYVCAQINRLPNGIRAVTLAFAESCVSTAVADVVGAAALSADPHFYNGGLTVMTPGDFMRPHLDNSHDHSGRLPRRVVILYYLSQSWSPGYGGNLEVWDGVSPTAARSIAFVPNRLVLLETTDRSWHSIRRIQGPHPRVNLTTYLYGPAAARSPVRLTRFRAWPAEPITNALLQFQFYARSSAQRLGLRRWRRNPHVWRRAAAVASNPRDTE